MGHPLTQLHGIVVYFGVQIYINVRWTLTPKTMPTKECWATSRCNSAPGQYKVKRMILMYIYMFLTMLSWLEQVLELSDVHQHQQQCQQCGPGLLQGVTQLPGIVEGCSWCPDICFWPSWVDWNWFQNCSMYTNTKNNANSLVQSHFKVQLSFLSLKNVDLGVQIYVFDLAKLIGTGFRTAR